MKTLGFLRRKRVINLEIRRKGQRRKNERVNQRDLIRFFAISKYSGDNSIPVDLCPALWAAISVEPAPANGSRMFDAGGRMGEGEPLDAIKTYSA